MDRRLTVQWIIAKIAQDWLGKCYDDKEMNRSDFSRLFEVDFEILLFEEDRVERLSRSFGKLVDGRQNGVLVVAIGYSKMTELFLVQTKQTGAVCVGLEENIGVAVQVDDGEPFANAV